MHGSCTFWILQIVRFLININDNTIIIGYRYVFQKKKKNSLVKKIIYSILYLACARDMPNRSAHTPLWLCTYVSVFHQFSQNIDKGFVSISIKLILQSGWVNLTFIILCIFYIGIIIIKCSNSIFMNHVIIK